MANGACIVSWARTARLDSATESTALESLASFEGVRATVAPAAYGRTYVLAQGGDGTDPAEVAARVDAQWFDDVIVALAIELRPADALPHVQKVFAGSGAPAGVAGVECAGETLILECSAQTSPSLLYAALDAELARWNGTRSARLLSPLPGEVVAAIAASGLQAPELTQDRVLDTLLGAHVE